MNINSLIKEYPEIKKVKWKNLDTQTQSIESKCIYNIAFKRDKHLERRSGLEIDRPKIESILSKFDNHESATFIINLDYQSKNTINMPLGFINCKAIKKSPDYYKDYNQSIETHGNLFWRGNIGTHQIRKKIINGLNLTSKKNFDLAHWSPASGSFYEDNACTEYEYDTYFDRLKQSDAFLIMRGDRPWTNSFFDCLRANAIPVCIDTFYNKLGWHKIGYKIDDLFLDFDSREDSIEKIENDIQELLGDKERVIYMKENLLRFYEKFILQDKHLLTYGASYASAGWGNVVKSKLLQIHNDDYKLRDNYLFTN